MPFSAAAHVARAGGGGHLHSDTDPEDNGHYVSKKEQHDLDHCYAYKAIKEQKQCVRDEYDSQFGHGTILCLSLLIVLLIMGLLGVICNEE
jgi:hypothetical protein